MAEYADYWRPTGQHPLIGLVGKAGAGKDTFAEILADAYGFVRVAFADRLRETALVVNPIVVPGDGTGLFPDKRLAEVVAEVGWDIAKREIPEVRRFLQHLGQGLRNTVDPDIWVNLAMEEVDGLAPAPVVVTDVRYVNEVQAIRDRRGVVVRIVRDGAGLDGAAATHNSETELDGLAPDVLIENNGELRHLAEQVFALGRRLAAGTFREYPSGA